MKNLLFAASLFTFGAAFASAADAQSSRFASYPAPVWSWSGFYLGVDAGYGWSNVDHSITVNALTVTVPTNAKGFIGGIYGGYNWQFNQFVAGVETDVSWGNITGTNSVVGKSGLVPFAFQAEDRLRWLGTTRARLGFLPVPSIMIYASAGVAYGGIEDSVIGSVGSSSVSSSFAQSSSTSETRFGFAAGAGIEWAINNNWMTRAEWLHYNLGSTATAFDASHQSGNIVRVGLGYKF
jgi:outer membrane immunogenic protein